MFRIYHFESPNTFNWLGLFAVIVSSISIFCTLYFIYLTKRAELKKAKFEKFCLEPLDDVFGKIDEIFSNSTSVNIYKQEITNGFLDIQLLLLILKRVYPHIPLENIILLTEPFTDAVYNADVSIKTDDMKSDYLGTKILIYNEFFKFAMTSEMSLFKKRQKRNSATVGIT